MASYLVGYKAEKEDPNLLEFSYGHSGERGKVLRDKVSHGDQLFFHTGLNQKCVITGVIYVNQVMPVSVARQNTSIVSKYKNLHLSKGYSKKTKRLFSAIRICQ